MTRPETRVCLPSAMHLKYRDLLQHWLALPPYQFTPSYMDGMDFETLLASQGALPQELLSMLSGRPIDPYFVSGIRFIERN